MNEWLEKKKRGAALYTGLYGNGMHDFILRECEVGFRAAAEEDSEACGFGPMLDAMFLEDIRLGRIS